MKKAATKKVPFEKRPLCVCGCKMKWVSYRGYYDEFKYWQCDNCKLDDEIKAYETDDGWQGAYA